MMQVIIAVIEYKMLHFLAVIQFDRGYKSLITHFLGVWQVFCLGTFCGN
jgi:hypothetical protein